MFIIVMIVVVVINFVVVINYMAIVCLSIIVDNFPINSAQKQQEMEKSA